MPTKARNALRAGRVEAVGCHGGSPGGHNNDQIRLHMSTGKVVYIDAYAMTGIVVTVKDPDG